MATIMMTSLSADSNERAIVGLQTWCATELTEHDERSYINSVNDLCDMYASMMSSKPDICHSIGIHCVSSISIIVLPACRVSIVEVLSSNSRLNQSFTRWHRWKTFEPFGNQSIVPCLWLIPVKATLSAGFCAHKFQWKIFQSIEFAA